VPIRRLQTYDPAYLHQLKLSRYFTPAEGDYEDLTNCRFQRFADWVETAIVYGLSVTTKDVPNPKYDPSDTKGTQPSAQTQSDGAPGAPLRRKTWVAASPDCGTDNHIIAIIPPYLGGHRHPERVWDVVVGVAMPDLDLIKQAKQGGATGAGGQSLCPGSPLAQGR
jgi:hypothetical protein